MCLDTGNSGTGHTGRDHTAGEASWGVLPGPSSLCLLLLCSSVGDALTQRCSGLRAVGAHFGRGLYSSLLGPLSASQVTLSLSPSESGEESWLSATAFSPALGKPPASSLSPCPRLPVSVHPPPPPPGTPPRGAGRGRRIVLRLPDTSPQIPVHGKLLRAETWFSTISSIIQQSLCSSGIL